MYYNLAAPKIINNTNIEMGENIDFDSLLIFEVESKPILYDRSLPQNNIKKIKNKIWTDIAIILGTSALVCKIRWKHLRHTFINYYKSIDSADSINWFYNEPLKFLIPFIEQNTSNSTSETSSLTEDSDTPELEQFSLSSITSTLTSSRTPSPTLPPPPPSSPTTARQPIKRRTDIDSDELFDILKSIQNRKFKQFKHSNDD